MHIASPWHLGKHIWHLFSSCKRGKIQRELAGPAEDRPVQYTFMHLSSARLMPDKRKDSVSALLSTGIFKVQTLPEEGN